MPYCLIHASAVGDKRSRLCCAHCVYIFPQAQDDKVEALEGALRVKRAAAEVR